MSQILSPEARERRQSIALSAPLRLSAHVCSRPNEISSAVLTRELVSVPAVSRIALVKPDRARAIEQLLMRMAQSGQLRGRVSEDQLIDVLDQVRTLTPRRSSRGTSEALTRGSVSTRRLRRWRKARAGARKGRGARSRSVALFRPLAWLRGALPPLFRAAPLSSLGLLSLFPLSQFTRKSAYDSDDDW